MLKPDFNRYSIALIKDNKIMFSSDESGLRPLMDCIRECKHRFSNCILHDKVVGLAAARIIVYSNIVSSVFTNTASEQAKDLLDNNRINMNADKIVKNILNKDKTDVCQMEQKARKIDNNEEFFNELNKLLH